MRIEQFTSHITLEQTATGVELTFDDYELKDYVEDYLIEECNIEGNYSERHGNSSFSLIFNESNIFNELRTYLDQLNKQEIERIWNLNN